MKKAIILNLALLVAVAFNYSSGMGREKSLVTEPPMRYRTLIINANVTVVLVNSNDMEAPVMTSEYLLGKLVTFKSMGDTLLISSAKKKDLREEGTIFIPANYLRNIRINSDAEVRSLNILEIPKLDVVINGNCRFAVSTVGQLNVKGTDSYSFDQNVKVRRIPASLLMNRGF